MSNCFVFNDLAEYFSVNSKTIYRRFWAKGVPAYKVDKIWRILKKEIKWLRQ